MKGILNNYIAERKRSRAGRLRTLVALFLLSAVVASSVVWCLRLVGTTLTDVPTYETAPQPAARRAAAEENSAQAQKATSLENKSGGVHISLSPSPAAEI